MMEGIKFGNIHSYDDLNLVLSSVDIPPATPKTNFVEIPAGDGSVDLSEALGEVKFQDRECKFVFTVFPSDDFEEKKTEVSNLLNGKRCKIILDKDPDFYWEGRLTVNEYAQDRNLLKITVGAKTAPYKLKNLQTRIVVPAGEKTVKSLWNSRKTVVPTITNTAPATITFKGQTFDIDAGTHKILNIELVQGVNQVTVTSTQPVTFTYQEGDL